MKKPFVRALMTGLLIVVLYYGFRTVQGMILTAGYDPNIEGQYVSSSSLPQKIAFGAADDPWWRGIECSGIILLGIAVYYSLRMIRRKKS